MVPNLMHSGCTVKRVVLCSLSIAAISSASPCFSVILPLRPLVVEEEEEEDEEEEEEEEARSEATTAFAASASLVKSLPPVK